MKVIFLKQIVPAAAIMLATAGAFGTHAMNTNSESLTNKPGFIRVDPLGNTCNNPETCTTDIGPICTVGGVPGATQLWGKTAGGKCTVELYRIQQ
jgi:hypothetical protein